MSHRHYQRRPDLVRMKPGCPLARARFAMLGEMPGTSYVHDSSLYHHDGTLSVGTGDSAATKWIRENGRRGTRFDGTDDHIYIPCRDFWSAGGMAYTVSLWVNPSEITSAQRHCFSQIGDNRYYICLENGYAYVQLLMNDWMGAGSTTQIPINTWTHLCGVYDGRAHFYVNGVFNSVSYARNEAFRQAESDVRIGCRAAYVDSFFKGQIADVAVWTEVLSLSEIATLASPDPMLDGWLEPPRRTVWRVAVAGTTAKPWIYYQQRRRARSAA